MTIPSGSNAQSSMSESKIDDNHAAQNFECDDSIELERHIAAGTLPADSSITARLLLTALKVEYPSNAMIEWMSRTSMELSRHVQHRRVG